MAKYINADDIEYTKKTFCYGPGWYELDERDEADVEFVLKKEIDEMPAADVRENIHGEWVPSDLDENFKVCSVCKNKGYKDRMAWRQDFIKAYLKFCPNCGADNRPNKRARI